MCCKTESEKIIGELGAAKKFVIHTKAPGFYDGSQSKKSIAKASEKSFKELGVDIVGFVSILSFPFPVLCALSCCVTMRLLRSWFLTCEKGCSDKYFLSFNAFTRASSNPNQCFGRVSLLPNKVSCLSMAFRCNFILRLSFPIQG